jgi:hypothetical protein
VAESPDCLGTPIARGMPEKPRAEVAPTPPVAIPETSVVEATVAELATEKAQAAIEAVELPTAAAEITGREGLGNPAADAAFERFMSEDIADEPSREWILAG